MSSPIYDLETIRKAIDEMKKNQEAVDTNVKHIQNQHEQECEAHLETKSQLSALRKKHTEVLAKVVELNDKLKSAEEDYKILDDEILDIEMHGTDHQNRQIERMEKKQKSLEDQLEEANKKIQEVEEKKDLEYEEMMKMLKERNEEIEGLNLKLAVSEEYIESVRSKDGVINQMNSEIHRLRETLDTLKKYNPKKKIGEMEKKEKSLEGDLELANAKIQEQTAQIKKLEEKKNDLMNEPSSYGRSNRSLLSSSSSSFMDSMYLESYGLPYSGMSQKERDEKKKEEDMEMESLCQKMKSEENFRFSSRQQYDRYNRWMAVQERNHNWEEQEIQFLEQDNQYLNEDIERNNQKIQMLKK